MATGSDRQPDLAGRRYMRNTALIVLGLFLLGGAAAGAIVLLSSGSHGGFTAAERQEIGRAQNSVKQECAGRRPPGRATRADLDYLVRQHHRHPDTEFSLEQGRLGEGDRLVDMGDVLRSVAGKVSRGPCAPLARQARDELGSSG